MAYTDDGVKAGTSTPAWQERLLDSNYWNQRINFLRETEEQREKIRKAVAAITGRRMHWQPRLRTRRQAHEGA